MPARDRTRIVDKRTSSQHVDFSIKLGGHRPAFRVSRGWCVDRDGTLAGLCSFDTGNSSAGAALARPRFT